MARARLVPALVLMALAGAAAPAAVPAPAWGREVLRVCADPNNMPFSNARGEGFENKLAELVAEDLGMDLAYTWWAQRRGFIRMTLKAHACDVIMGVPMLDMIETTRPYYRSRYVFVSRADRDLTFSAMTAPQLRALRIGVHLIGDDGANTPPAHALGEQGIVDNVAGYMIYGDYRQDSPPSALIEAVARGDVDIAAVWGPLAGYYAKRSPVPLRIVPITDTVGFLPLVFHYSIGMGVRDSDDEEDPAAGAWDEALVARLDEVIVRRRDDIRDLLEDYGVPLN